MRQELINKLHEAAKQCQSECISGGIKVGNTDVPYIFIEGAKWIKSNYYDNGYTTLDSMHQAGYASDPNWASQISSLANAAIGLI